MTIMPMGEGVWVPEWTLADRLRKARLSTKLGQREFAAQLGVSAPTYAQWEADNNRPRDLVAIAKRIELLTKIPASWVLGLETSSRPAPPDGGGVGPAGLEPTTSTVEARDTVMRGPWARAASAPAEERAA